jgi:serine/threonine protein kinase
MCPQNLLFCTHSLIKLGTNLYPSQVPLQTKSPEVLRDERPTYASDIYSLGTVIYRMIYGCYPFDGNN